MDTQTLISAYRLIGELFLYPENRDPAFIRRELDALGGGPDAVRRPIETFLAAPQSQSLDVYLETLEMSPTCPPYLGTYLFEEPSSCRGAGMSGRNNYMLELVNAYGHFGLELNGRELADFVPVVAEFLALSLERKSWDAIGLRRRIVEAYVQPAMAPALQRFSENGSCYAGIIEALDATLQKDAEAMRDDPIWVPPEDPGGPGLGKSPVKQVRPSPGRDQPKEMGL